MKRILLILALFLGVSATTIAPSVAQAHWYGGYGNYGGWGGYGGWGYHGHGYYPYRSYYRPYYGHRHWGHYHPYGYGRPGVGVFFRF